VASEGTWLGLGEQAWVTAAEILTDRARAAEGKPAASGEADEMGDTWDGKTVKSG
jgi:hypothetical protein